MKCIKEQLGEIDIKIKSQEKEQKELKMNSIISTKTLKLMTTNLTVGQFIIVSIEENLNYKITKTGKGLFDLKTEYLYVK